MTQETFEKARSAREKAYAPYSKFKVGAALKVRDYDQIICGCNVENASYGGTLCAERVAICSAVFQARIKEVEYMVLVTDTQPVSVPCGFCLQVMAEFFPSDFCIYLADLEGIKKTFTLGELLPQVFNRQALS